MQKQYTRSISGFTWLSTFFWSLLVAYFLFTSKHGFWGTYAVIPSALVYPFTLVLIQLVARLYGYTHALFLINGGVIAYLSMALILWCAQQLPYASAALIKPQDFSQALPVDFAHIIVLATAYYLSHQANLSIYMQRPCTVRGLTAVNIGLGLHLITPGVLNILLGTSATLSGNAPYRLVEHTIPWVLAIPCTYLVHSNLTSPAPKHHKPRLPATYMALHGLFLVALLLTNVLTLRLFSWWKVTLTAGVLSYPLSFFCIDLITELYGKRRAQEVVLTGLAASLLVTMLCVTFRACCPSYKAFGKLFSLTPGLVCGSMAAYLVGQHADIHVFQALRVRTKGKYLWLRNNLSTSLGQLLDKSTFALVTWLLWVLTGQAAKVMWFLWYQVTLSEYMLSMAFALLGTPLIYLVTGLSGKDVQSKTA